MKNPQTARGGPWSKPSMTAEMLEEVRKAATVRSWLSLEAVASPGGALSRHLRNLAFIPDAGARRGAVVSARRSSGRSYRSGTAAEVI